MVRFSGQYLCSRFILWQTHIKKQQWQQTYLNNKKCVVQIGAGWSNFQAEISVLGPFCHKDIFVTKIYVNKQICVSQFGGVWLIFHAKISVLGPFHHKNVGPMKVWFLRCHRAALGRVKCTQVPHLRTNSSRLEFSTDPADPGPELQLGRPLPHVPGARMT